MKNKSIHAVVQQVERQAPYFLQSRIHQLMGFGPQVFVKRDDELSFGISGTKLRKLASLVLAWKKQGVQFIEALGGGYSNHIMATVQAAIEHGIAFRLHLLKPHHTSSLVGNGAFLKLLTTTEQIRWVERSDWPKLVEDFANKSCSNSGASYFMNEGGNNIEALTGAMTLGKDILHHQETSFDHIFLDAGTGLSAAATCLYLGAAGYKGAVHIVLMAPNLQFKNVLSQTCLWAQQLGLPMGPLPHIELYQPATARSFGSVNKTVMNEVKRMASEHGIIVDPIYSAKLFHTARTILPELNEDKTLIVHSGGALSLTGFWKHFYNDED